MEALVLNLPQLTPQQQADPYAMITINGVSVQLWQVAHIYGLAYDIPRLAVRSGASSSDFRRWHPRPRGPRTVSAAAASPARGQLSSCDSPTLPPHDPTTRKSKRQVSRACGRGGRVDTSTRDLHCLLDDLIDGAWSDDEGGPSGGCATAAPDTPDTPRLGTRPSDGQTSAEPPGPPPTRPLPPAPPPPSLSSVLHGQGHRRTHSRVPSTANFSRPLRSQTIPPAHRDTAGIQPGNGQSVTPPMPGSQPCANAQVRDASVLMPRLNQPATADGPGTAVVGSRPRDSGADEHIRRQQDTDVSKHWKDRPPGLPRLPPAPPLPRLPPPLPPPLPLPLPPKPPFQQLVYRQHGTVLTEVRPDVPPKAPQLPHQRQRHGQAAPTGNPLPGIPRPAFDMAMPETRPLTPPPQEDEGLKSRWSPDSSPEQTAMRRVKRVLSFAMLRRKS
ncbi:hypothetical protein BT67DRAFT_436550 [Trichocladium antarcticum]|uniref:Uncharacterized protein n=1 Tax=Trichocladium antarcticum TaxID=1450529 RepID=A0AAN6UE05_9PEZI|nr:hypothetical protein BT67DRAFT_436550 [Trichocladium antarcticum]